MAVQKKKSCIAEILVFRMYSQAAQARTALRLLEYHLGKVCGKNYLDDEQLYKICELVKIKQKITSSLLHFFQCNFTIPILFLFIFFFFGNGHTGSFNNLSKIGDAVLALWCRILNKVPHSRMLMKCKPFASESVKKKVFFSFLPGLAIFFSPVCPLPIYYVFVFLNSFSSSLSVMELLLNVSIWSHCFQPPGIICPRTIWSTYRWILFRTLERLLRVSRCTWG